jgi:uracil-DNA glycosylase
LQALEEEFEKPYFRRLSEIIEVERSKFAVYPSMEEVWSWTTRAPIQDTRVVILGKA